MNKAQPVTKFDLKKLLPVLAIIIVSYIVISRIDSLVGTFQMLRKIDAQFLAASTTILLITYLAAAASLKLLAFYNINYSRLFIVQLAGGFANKLAPAGLGNMALNSRFLTKNKHTIWQATTVAVTNNIIGFIGHMMLLLGAGMLLWQNPFPAISLRLSASLVFLTFLMCFAILLLIFRHLRRKIIISIKNISKSLSHYSGRLNHLLGALTLSVCITYSYTLILFLCVDATGAHITLFEALAVLTAGVFGNSVAPTPGGIGGAEAALVVALAAIGLPASICLASALLYRFITYWLPILPGLFAFQFINKNKHYI